MALLLGLDVGTSGLKALAIDGARGAVVAEAHRGYPLDTPQAGWAEQDPTDYQGAANGALAELAAKLGPRAAEVEGIGLSGQMHSAVLLDQDLAVVRPAILWCDVRTAEACRALEAAVGHEGLVEAVQNRVLEGFTLPKLVWLREHEPAAFARVRHVLMPKDYVALGLTGELSADVSDASGTLAFDPARRRPAERLLAAAGIDGAWFPRAGESCELVGQLTPEVARATGLAAGTPVVRGAADNAAGAVGLGVVRDGRAMVSVGTSGVVLAHTSRPVVDPGLRLHAFCHAVPGASYLMSVMLAAGGALRFYRDRLCDGEKLAAEIRGTDPYEILTEAASTSREGAGGLVFLPYIMGERTPHADANARGAFVGISAATTKGDFSRAVLEGITFGLADGLDLVRAVAPAPLAELRLTGGGAKSAFWRQLMADVFGLDVVLTTSSEGPAFGAALLAGVGAGVFGSVEEAADALVHVTQRTAPRAAIVGRYEVVRAEYRALYPALRERFAALARLA